MKNQLDLFKRKYKIDVSHVDDDDMHNYMTAVDEMIDKLPNKTYTLGTLRGNLKVDRSKIINISDYNANTFAYMIVNNSRMKWIDCGCGTFGKFRKVR